MGVRDVIHPTIEIAGFLTDALDKWTFEKEGMFLINSG